MQKTLAFAVVSSMLALVSCQTKLRECSRLVGTINAAGKEAEKAAPVDAGVPLAQRMSAITGAIDAKRSAIASAELTDAKLKTFQADYLALLDRASTAAKQRVAAEGSNDQARIEAADKDLRAVTNDEKALVATVNDYCSVGAK